MKYETKQPNSDGWTNWVKPVMKGYRIRCCDCKLVHVFEFKILDGRVILRAKRHVRATSASRRKKGGSP